MKTFKTFLAEELNDTQKSAVDSWTMPTKKTLSHTDHYFGEGNHVKTYPLEGSEDKSEIHKKIEQHLGSQISPEDYKQGVAEDKYGRKTRIGGLLAKSKASPELINNFANDTTRQGKKFSGLTVHISRHPHDVAGQTSNQSWAQESCKNFDTGMNKHYLKDEVANGTVVGYLKDHTGKEIARTTFQPYVNDKKRVMYRTNSHYGIKHQGFMDEMEKVADQLSGEHKSGDLMYTIHPKVYNDNNKTQAIHPSATSDDITNILTSKPTGVGFSSIHKVQKNKITALNHPKVTDKHLDIAFNDSDPNIRHEAALHPKATAQQLDNVIEKDNNDMVVHAAIKNKNMSSNTLDKVYDKTMNSNDPSIFNSTVRHMVLRHPNLSTQKINDVLNDKFVYHEDKVSVLKNPRITSEHIDIAMKDPHLHEVRGAAVSHPSATSKQIDQGLADKSESVRAEAASNPNVLPHHIDKALNDESFGVKSRMINANARKFTSEQIDKALSDNNTSVRYNMVYRGDLTPRHIDKALKDENDFVRTYALQHKNATKDNFMTALNSSDTSTRAKAAKWTKDPEVIHHALNDEHHHVRMAAASNVNATEENIHKALNDNHISVKRAAVENNNATPDNLTKALRDPEDDLSQEVMNHPSFRSDHIFHMIDSPHVAARNKALRSTNYHSVHSLTSRHIDHAIDNFMKHDTVPTSEHEGVVNMLASPAIKPQHIDKLLTHKDSAIHSLVGANGYNLNNDHITKILGSKNALTRASIFSNYSSGPNISRDNFNTALHDRSKAVVLSALTHSRTPADLVSPLINHPDKDISFAAKTHVNHFGN